jgi:hypothetical protein
MAELVGVGKRGGIADPIALLAEMQPPEANQDAAGEPERLPQPVHAEQQQAKAQRGRGNNCPPDGCGDDQPHGGSGRNLEHALRAGQAYATGGQVHQLSQR